MVQEHENQECVEEELLSCKFYNEFTVLSDELQAKNDKYEKIVKIGRDTTIESKHLIFALHARLRDDKMNEPSKKIENDIEKILMKFEKIADLLQDEDPYLFLRAWYSGVEEFVEAITFYKYMTTGKLCSWEEVQQTLAIKTCQSTTETDQPNIYKSPIKLQIPLLNYILGVQDMSGELMRLCIGALCSGKKDLAVNACQFVKVMYMAMIGFVPQSKDFRKKLEVLKVSLLKMEYAVYTFNIRGTEIPSHMIEDVIRKNEASFLF